jgi:hypothetical protein
MEKLGVEADLIRWTNSFMSERRVRLVLDGEEGAVRRVETGIPQGSPVAPILFVTYLSGIFEEVEEACEGKGLSFTDDVAWVEGKDDREVAEKLSKASEAACKWAARNGITFDHGKSEAVFFSRARPTATIRTGGHEIPFNRKATRWLGVWLDSQLTLGEHQKVMMKGGAGRGEGGGRTEQAWAHHLHGRVKDRQRGGRLRGGMAERTAMGRHQVAHGLQSGGL